MISFQYHMLDKYYIPIIKYACQTCDAFGLTFHRLRPLKDNVLQIVEKEIYEKLLPYLIKNTFDETPWNREWGCVFTIYKSCTQTASILSKVGRITNWFAYYGEEQKRDLPWANMDMPEDLSFFRKNKVWLRTVMHEEIAYISNDTKEDVEFFKQLGMRAYYSDNAGDTFPVNYNLYRIIK